LALDPRPMPRIRGGAPGHASLLRSIGDEFVIAAGVPPDFASALRFPFRAPRAWTNDLATGERVKSMRFC
jgi:hypothetical protein